MVVCAFNPSSQEVESEAVRSLSGRPAAWPTEKVPAQPRLHREVMSWWGKSILAFLKIYLKHLGFANVWNTIIHFYF